MPYHSKKKQHNNNSKRSSAKKKAGKKNHQQKLVAAAATEWNFDLEAGPGCHIARIDLPTWTLDWEAVDPQDFEEDEEIPDLALDEEGVLSLCNIQTHYVVAYVTVYDRRLRGRHGQLLQQGSTTDNEGKTDVCTTLIVLCPPRTFAHLCHILDYADIENPQDLRLDSDVQEWGQHSNPSDTHPQTISFPLQGDGPFRCTQGEGGQLTHFFAGNLHAVDFACPIGTPLLAVGNGVVVQVHDNHRLTGIAVSNLFKWNSILLKLDPKENGVYKILDDALPDNNDDDPLFVEYVHIQTSLVKTGDRVVEGQVIGTSGSVGFSPEPHLHFAAYRSSEATAATVRVYFEFSSSSQNNGSSSKTFVPMARCFYNATGQIIPADTTT